MLEQGFELSSKNNDMWAALQRNWNLLVGMHSHFEKQANIQKIKFKTVTI